MFYKSYITYESSHIFYKLCFVDLFFADSSPHFYFIFINELTVSWSQLTCQKCVLCLHLIHHCQNEYQLHRYRPSSKFLRWTSSRFGVNQHHVDVSSLTSCRFDGHDPEFHDTAQNGIVAYLPPFGRYD